MNITALRRLWFSISGTMVGLSVLAVIMFGLNLGLDFTGGARWDIQFETQEGVDPISRDALYEFIAKLPQLEQSPTVQASEANMFLITVPDMADAKIQEIAVAVKKEFGAFKQKSYRKVDATIGASFKEKSLIAIAMTLIGIILFVAFAFRHIPAAINPWRFGTVAIIALFHDIVIVVGIFAVLGFISNVELGLPFITALLATLGFSVNDTIVILDRVRENIRQQKAHETFADTIEKSIQQTLFRSLNTSISTLMPLIALLAFGAPSIFHFVLALTLGIGVGTYSSIFVAAPLLVSWKNWADSRD